MNEELLIRFLTKTCTREEIFEVQNWISANRTNAAWLFEMERIWSLKDILRYSDRKEIEAAYRRFVRVTSQAKQEQAVKRQLHRGWMRYAAAVAIVCLLAANIYQAFRSKSSDEVAVNTVEVPIGHLVAITLSDSSKVWLNSGSVLNYPAKFDHKNRVVYLVGEAYFEVTADKECPFVVNTSALDVKALGTKFNVQSYRDDDVSVSLLEGQLYIQAGKQWVLMAANELVTWSKASGLKYYKNKEVRHAAQWTSGEMIFVDERMANIAKTLERQFGVTIVIDTPELADERFTCRTQQNATLEQVLDLFKRTKKLNYSIKEKTVHIKSRK